MKLSQLLFCSALLFTVEAQLQIVNSEASCEKIRSKCVEEKGEDGQCPVCEEDRYRPLQEDQDGKYCVHPQIGMEVPNTRAEDREDCSCEKMREEANEAGINTFCEDSELFIGKLEIQEGNSTSGGNSTEKNKTDSANTTSPSSFQAGGAAGNAPSSDATQYAAATWLSLAGLVFLL